MLEEVRTRRRRQRRAAVGDSVNGGNEEKEKTKTKKRTKICKTSFKGMTRQETAAWKRWSAADKV